MQNICSAPLKYFLHQCKDRNVCMIIKTNPQLYPILAFSRIIGDAFTFHLYNCYVKLVSLHGGIIPQLPLGTKLADKVTSRSNHLYNFVVFDSQHKIGQTNDGIVALLCWPQTIIRKHVSQQYVLTLSSLLLKRKRSPLCSDQRYQGEH